MKKALERRACVGSKVVNHETNRTGEDREFEDTIPNHGNVKICLPISNTCNESIVDRIGVEPKT
jgi:hypothetical protein